MVHTVTTRKMEANEGGRGNLAGTQVSCSCGYVEGTTLDSEVQFMAASHLKWAANVTAKGRRK